MNLVNLKPLTPTRGTVYIEHIYLDFKRQSDFDAVTELDVKGRVIDNIFVERLWKSLSTKTFISTLTKMG